MPQSLNELGIVTKQRKVNLFLPLSKLFLQFLLPFHFKISMNMRITRNKITNYLTFRGRLLVRVDFRQVDVFSFLYSCRNPLGCAVLSAHVRACYCVFTHTVVSHMTL